MEAQKPLGTPRPHLTNPPSCTACPPCEYDAEEEFVSILRLLIDRIVPPRWVCMTALALAVIYFAPAAALRWLNLFTKLKIAYRRWELGYDLPDLLAPVPKRHPRSG